MVKNALYNVSKAKDNLSKSPISSDEQITIKKRQNSNNVEAVIRLCFVFYLVKLLQMKRHG